MATSSNAISDTTGILTDKDACVVIVKTEWNAPVVDALEEGCIRVLGDKGICFKQITVPGAFELTFAIKNYWENHKYRDDKPTAFIALGCIIRGATPHFEYVSLAVTNGITQLNLELPVPTVFGVLTVNDQLQADERIGGREGHKGEEAAATAIKMMALVNDFKKYPTNSNL